jgi:ribosomal protein L11 methyltransferase
MSQEFRAFEVHFAPEHADDVISLLWELGTAGLEEKAPGHVLAYFPAAAAEPVTRAMPPGVVASPVPVAEVDWVARFREGFGAFDAAGFHVQPIWDPAPAGPLTLVVDPGRAFGTGTHETTRLCLGALREIAAAGPLGRVLDYGSGTGLLAVAAARLGATSVAAVDVDAEAVSATVRHARLNGVVVGAVLADGGSAFREGAFDLVLANVTAPLLSARRDEISRLRARGGRVVLSGLLWEEVDSVRAAYSERLGAMAARRDGEWGALVR